MPTGTRKSSNGDEAKKTGKEQAPTKKAGKRRKTPKVVSKAGAKKRRTSKSKLVDKAIACFEKKLDNEDMKATVGDFIRLLQLQKEFEGDDTQEIKVTWVEPEGTESV